LKSIFKKRNGFFLDILKFKKEKNENMLNNHSLLKIFIYLSLLKKFNEKNKKKLKIQKSCFVKNNIF
jgi:hypothetical protein